MKACVFFIFQLLPWIAWVGDWALRWTEGSEALQIAFVMFVFPVIMNALQYCKLFEFRGVFFFSFSFHGLSRILYFTLPYSSPAEVNSL